MKAFILLVHTRNLFLYVDYWSVTIILCIMWFVVTWPPSVRINFVLSRARQARG